MRLRVKAGVWKECRDVTRSLGTAIAAIMAVNVCVWFGTAPFISDAAEQEIRRFLPAMAIALAADLTLSALFAQLYRRATWHAERDRLLTTFDRQVDELLDRLAAPSYSAAATPEELGISPAMKSGEVPPTCFRCKYFTAEPLLPCTVHPVEMRNDCPDFEQERG